MGRKHFTLATTAFLGTLAAVVMILLVNNSSKSSLMQNPFNGYKVVSTPYGMMRAMPGRGQLPRENRFEMRGQPVFKPSSLNEEENVDQTAFPSELPDEPAAEAEAEESSEKAQAEKEDPLADDFVDVSELDGNEEQEEPDNKLGDEVIDLPKPSEQSDLGDFYVSGKDAEKNKYMFKQRGARASVLYNAADPFNVASHKPPCKFQCKDDPWGPGCDGHGALSNGDCEEVIDANGDRFIPVDKMAPATYDSFSGNTHGLFKGQKGQALLARRGRAAGDRPRAQGLWLGENWGIDGLKYEGAYMVPADEEEKEGYGNSLFDFGKDGGTPFNPETRMPAPGMTQFYRPGDGDKPGLFDLDGIRRNEDGGLPASWYAQNEPAFNFASRGRGKWAPGRDPSVMIMDGHVQFIDDGIPFPVPRA